MAPPKNNPSKNQPAKDFAKRPKAKVGKRAPAKLNATDTSFKTSSVSVRSQSTSLDKNVKTKADAKSSLVARMELQSSRGNALSTLQVSLRHHAAAVRCSGLKGIRDAVQSLASCGGEKSDDDYETVQIYNLGLSILESNLPSLLPNMCRCWLDEDGDVRDLAIQLFGDIISNLSGGATCNASHLTCLVPFVPFLCAYASSALNSLDRDIRKDGALLVGMMASCTPYPSFSLLEEEEGSSDVSLVALRAEVGKHVDLFLPSLERLLSSMSFGSRTKAKTSGGKNDKKRKRDDKSAKKSDEPASSSFKSLGAADATILSLALLLKASLSKSETDSSDNATIGNNLVPSLRTSGECSFLKGGSAHANSMMFFRDAKRQDTSPGGSLKPINTIFDLPYMPVDDTGASVDSIAHDLAPIESPNQQLDGDLEKAQVLSTVVETLRIKFVELTQAGRSSNNGRRGIMLPVSDLDTLGVLVKALKFASRRGQFFRDFNHKSQLHGESANASVKRQKKSMTKKSNVQDMGACFEAYQSSISKAVSLILDNFPICSLDGKVSAPRYGLSNAELCSTLADLGGESLCSEESSSLWADAVFAYILPRLSPEENTDAGSVTDVLLQIARKLLLPTDADESGLVYLLKSQSKRLELLQVFGDVFFPSKLIMGPAKHIESLTEEGQGLWLKNFASTSAGRTAAGLLISLMSWLGGKSTMLDKDTCMLVMQMASVLPLYLLSWQHEYPIETRKVLASMLSMTRQWSTNSDESSSTAWHAALSRLCISYRQSIGIMFCSSKAVQKQANIKSQTNSILERSPEFVQKLAIGLVCMLGSPNETLVNSIAKICSRVFSSSNQHESVITTTMAEYIYEVMHNTRKTMSVSIYLSFLINASGIDKVALPDVALHKSLFSYDTSIQILCRFMICSRDEAPSKVLPMIRPTLEKWLSIDATETSGRAKQIIRARAAISIVAAFTWNELYPDCQEGSAQSEFLKLDDTFDDLLLSAIMSTFQMLEPNSTTKSQHSEEDLNKTIGRLIGPVTLIFCFRDGMMTKYLHEIQKRISLLGSDKQNGDSSVWIDAGTQLKVLLVTLQSKEPASVCSLVKNQAGLKGLLQSLAGSLEQSVANTHLVTLSEKVSYEVNHILRMTT
ncbi:hypothetical protein ACHAWO_013618 [Cyclotella atomus]|uniref:Pre-rRNA-processing protein Ipi1 N-terminal domain-containing protein n=1 Tax=Cyclotella atomus TaxID=382360 RepID=A0ABD3PT91_9STRA